MTVESTELDVGANLSRVRGEVDAAARMVERDPKTITVCAVSKTHGPARIRDVIAAGHRVFGENRVQEAESKWPELKAETANIELHLIGPLQTNKVRKALALFDVVQTVDRPKLARALAREMARLDRRIPCYVQVNTGDEPQKAGVRPDDADAFIETCLR